MFSSESCTALMLDRQVAVEPVISENTTTTCMSTQTLRVRLHQVSESTLQQLCNNTSNTSLIENNGITPEWGCNTFSSDPIVTGRNEVVAKAIFLHLFVNFFTRGGGGIPQGTEADPPPRTRHTTPLDQAHHTHTRTRHTPPDQAQHPPRPGTPPRTRHTPPRTRHTPPPPGSRLRHTVYERPVRILLECILVFYENSIKSVIAALSKL